MLRLSPILALAAGFAACAQHRVGDDYDAAGEAILATVPYDVVALLDEGVERLGDEVLFVVYDHFRYTFDQPEAKRQFEADPERYAAQLGGACARMGALSATGMPSLYTVHEGKLYFFASEGCRDGFLAAPDKVLEPLMDQAVTSGANEALVAHELIEKSLAFLGGADSVDGAQLDWSLSGEQEYDGQVYETAQRELVGPGARYLTCTRWGEDAWTNRLDGDHGSLEDTWYGKRIANLSQRRAMERRLQAHLFPLYQLRNDEHTYLSGSLEKGGVGILHLSVQGFSHRLGIDWGSGRILWHEYGGMGPDTTFGTVRDSFLTWETQDGLQIPIAWNRSFDGGEELFVSRGDEGWRVKVRRGDSLQRVDG